MYLGTDPSVGSSLRRVQPLSIALPEKRQTERCSLHLGEERRVLALYIYICVCVINILQCLHSKLDLSMKRLWRFFSLDTWLWPGHSCTVSIGPESTTVPASCWVQPWWTRQRRRTLETEEEKHQPIHRKIELITSHLQHRSFLFLLSLYSNCMLYSHRSDRPFVCVFSALL